MRRQTSENSFLYVGFLDKVFGLRIADHTSFARRLTGTTQNDQAHGLMWYQKGEKFDFFMQASAGNLLQKKELRVPGGSLGWRAG
ncbi:MAG: hypothetical protein HC902_06750 [Calothrix sp. SM1_5_4]|nr:hypothetical protein [Calothrix sp. SM1_5_4]